MRLQKFFFADAEDRGQKTEYPSETKTRFYPGVLEENTRGRRSRQKNQ